MIRDSTPQEQKGSELGRVITLGCVLENHTFKSQTCSKKDLQ